MPNREMQVAEAARRGREAFERQEWTEAFRHLRVADDATSLSIDELELLAASAYLIGQDEISADIWTRAYQQCLRSRDVPRATRFAFWLVLSLLLRSDIARASGWLTRAQRILDEEGVECAERGLLVVLTARVLLKRGELQAAFESASQAASIADRFEDSELSAFVRLIRGQVCVARGEAAKAAALFDETMVAATVGDVSPIAVGVIYCAVIDACRQLFDIQRAREWTDALSRWCGAQPDLVPFRGQCLVHRVEILRLSGAWPQALNEAKQATAWLSQLAGQAEPSGPGGGLPVFKYPIGAAFYELAELHRVLGDFAQAEECYRRASQCGQSPEPGLALLRMAQGRLQLAKTSIRLAVGQQQSRVVRTEVLAACVEIMIAAGDLPTARSAAEELQAIAAESGAPLLAALSAQSIGCIQLAGGEVSAALTSLRAAWMTWQELDAPYDAARVRVQLGLACRALANDEAAELELHSARLIFERLAAAPDVARVNTLLKTAAASGNRGLTAREREVIGLVATGKTNRAIARQLSISERTVDRHVSSILMKLELASRSAATAYAYEHGLV